MGPDTIVPTDLEPDTSLNGFVSIGASRTTISARGVEQYETAVYQLMYQVLLSPLATAQVLACEDPDPWNAACARASVAAFGRRAFRRSLTASEVDSYLELATEFGEASDSTLGGVVFAVAGMLQSPNFLFRTELGELKSGDKRRVFTDYEMASRLSFLLWNTTPDETLLDAAEGGELSTADGLARHAERMLESPRARDAVRNFFTELLELDHLDGIFKDTELFPQMSPELAQSAREQTLMTFEDLVFDRNGSFLDVFDTREAFVDATLASLYDVPPPSGNGFSRVTLPEGSPRLGLVGHASLLMANAHETQTSPTLRGRFIRQVLLCGEVPPPPPNADTNVPEPSGDAPTMRDRLAQHATDPNCASCHNLMDPIGLGLENFDAIGAYRETDNGATIDPSGQLDSLAFADAAGLAKAMREHPDVASCFVRKLYRYATGRIEARSEQLAIDDLTGVFANSGHRVKALLLALISSDAFRVAGELR